MDYIWNIYFSSIPDILPNRINNSRDYRKDMEMKNKIYLIIGSSGIYSDYESHVVSAYKDKSLAYTTCHQMNVELENKKKKNYDYYLKDDDEYDLWLDETHDYSVKEVDFYG